MSTTDWILVGIGVILLLLLIQVGSLVTYIKSVAVALGQDLGRAQQSRDDLASAMADCSSHLEHIRDKLAEIGEVAEIARKYKLPNRQQQRDLDELAFEEEHWRRVAEALSGKANEDDA